jgi:acyl transferase domain-containing protein/acyl carrier protein
MKPRNAFLFPSLGSHLPGLYGNLAADYPVIEETLATVDGVATGLGYEPVSPLLLDARSPTAQELVDRNAGVMDLAIFAASVTAFRLLVDGCGVRPDIVVGHSFGEFAALTAAGAFSVEDGARLVVRCDESLRRCDPSRGGLMALNCGARRASALLTAVDGWQLCVAVDNGPDQVVVSGPDRELEQLRDVAEALGLTAVRLRVRYPFHNRLLLDVAEDFARRAAAVPKRVPRLRVYSPLLSRYVADVEEVERVVTGHLVTPVSFLDAVRTLHADGVRQFVESGPKAILVDLVNGVLPDVVTVAPLRQRIDRKALVPTVEPLIEDRDDERAGPAPRTGRPAHIPTRHEPAPAVGAHLNGSRSDRDAVFDVVRRLYADLLGYPPEVFEADADLEADLGLDSVRQTEAFARALERFGLPLPPTSLRVTSYPTIAAVVDLLMELGAGRAAAGTVA